MLRIYAHRGLVDGDPRAHENSLATLARAVDAGFSIETDTRWGRGRELVVYHDPDLERVFGDPRATRDVDAAELRRLYEARNAEPEPCDARLSSLLAWSGFDPAGSAHEILVNIKEPDDLEFCVATADEILKAGRAATTWLFDLDQGLVEPLHRARPDVRILARLSHLPGEDIETVEKLVDHVAGVWFDDFFGTLLGTDVAERAAAIGIPLIYVSPELHRDTHPQGVSGRREAWARVSDIPAFEGICTDFPVELGEFLRGNNTRKEH